LNYDYQIRNYILRQTSKPCTLLTNICLAMTEQDHIPLESISDTVIYANVSHDSFSGFNLKRRASPSFEGLEEDSRKRMKGDDNLEQCDESMPNALSITYTLADELAQELQCGCCSELVYRPVIVAPCQHFFCGRWFLPFII